jgi:hypothetical protein
LGTGWNAFCSGKQASLYFLSMTAYLPTMLPGFHPFGLLLAQAADDASFQQTPANPLAGMIGGSIGLLVGLISIVSMWKIFTKAGQPGWACLIPIYNLYIMCKVAQKPGWWLLLMFVPFVNFIFLVLLSVGMARSFGKGAGFGLGILFLGFIFLPILAFGDARYQGATFSPLMEPDSASLPR